MNVTSAFMAKIPIKSVIRCDRSYIEFFGEMISSRIIFVFFIQQNLKMPRGFLIECK